MMVGFKLLLCMMISHSYYLTCVQTRIVITIDSSSSEESPPTNDEAFHCADRMRNQDESDIDCGGLECPRCQDLLRCKTCYDCMSSLCQNNKIQRPPQSFQNRLHPPDQPIQIRAQQLLQILRSLVLQPFLALRNRAHPALRSLQSRALRLVQVL
ncbi:unnamed protein product [Adineta steineri]|uniref:Uncharacterized protein n=1 Tax=Adineta steineri TaxID=433720 RepID=A0A814RHF4_9BILA|nr:unnamed protein product [Adineta steineri]